MTRQIAVRLPARLVEELDRLVGHEGGPSTRTEAIRRAVEAYVREVDRRAVDLAIVEGYRRVPPGQPDEWGDLAAQTDAAARESRRALDLEDGGW